MSDDSTVTIVGTFPTREAADRAVEHLVQQHGIPRGDVFVGPGGEENSSGTAPSGADYSADGPLAEPALEGPIMVSADLGPEKASKAEQVFREVGASRVENR